MKMYLNTADAIFPTHGIIGPDTKIIMRIARHIGTGVSELGTVGIRADYLQRIAQPGDREHYRFYIMVPVPALGEHAKSNIYFTVRKKYHFALIKRLNRMVNIAKYFIFAHHMELRTPIKIRPEDIGIDYHKQGLMTGSCFAENIGMRMRSLAMPVTVNPMGIQFNPASICRSLNMLAKGYVFTEKNLTENNGLWVSFAHHGSFSDKDKNAALQKMNLSAENGSRALTEADYIIITLGTAWIYERDGYPVGNCHKFPASEFTRRRMETEEIVDIFSSALDTYLNGKKVIFTVSPIRHLSDGLADNSLSKATLRVAAGRLCEKYTNCRYFPAYEIMTDDLRDYRFYERDMVHPSELAVDYIWEQFCIYAMTHEAIKAMGDIAALNAAAAHRPIDPQSDGHRQFIAKMITEARELQKRHPNADLAGHIETLEKKLPE